MNKRSLFFWLILISLFFVFIVRDLFRDGMFMDGTIYAAVAKNLANGLGSFWHPYFSQTKMSIYHEQPPLMFGIEALFFKVLGNSIYVERFYGLLIALLTAFLIHALWKWLLRNGPGKEVSWLPILFWISIPVSFWSYSNNMEEPTMGVFDLASLLFICNALILKKPVYLNLGLAALMLIAASMCKGPQGLFPLASVFFYWIIFRNISFFRMLLYSLFILLIIVAFYGSILLNETVYKSYELYFNNRIVTTFMHPAGTHTDRFFIIKNLFSELLPVFIMMSVGIILIQRRKTNYTYDQSLQRTSFWLFLVALSGTLPLMLTLEQSDYYLVTVMPFYALCFALPFARFAYTSISEINITSKKYKLFTGTAWVLLVASLIFSVVAIAHFPKRDNQKLHDLYSTGQVIKEGSTIGIPEEMSNEWPLFAYYERYFNISLDASPGHLFFLIDKKLDPKLVPEGYKIVNIPTQLYNLYTKNP